MSDETMTNGNGKKRIVITPETHFAVTVGGFIAAAVVSLPMLWKLFALVAAVEAIPQELRRHCETDWNVYHESQSWQKFSEMNPTANLKTPDAHRVKKGTVE